jgi:hydroxymethylbilane synthase
MTVNSLPTGKTIRLGSRGSELALWQTNYVRDLLQTSWPGIEVELTIFKTRGDKILDTPLPLIGGKGLFTAELETALRDGTIDAAVHSLKDLPTEMPEGLAIGAIPQRSRPADVLVSKKGHTLETLPEGARVGTGSRRRTAQLLALRPDLTMVDIRGNVPTRIAKTLDETSEYDAVVLAYAGLERLGLLDRISQVLPIAQVLPAPGQGALGIQCRDEATSLKIFRPLDLYETRAEVEAERSFLAGLGGGCAVPIAAYGQIGNGRLSLTGRVSALDGSSSIDVQAIGLPDEARKLGAGLAIEALARGAAELLGAEH